MDTPSIHFYFNKALFLIHGSRATPFDLLKMFIYFFKIIITVRPISLWAKALRTWNRPSSQPNAAAKGITPSTSSRLALVMDTRARGKYRKTSVRKEAM